ncbi:MAG: hypothetical protein AB2A00_02130 [Myxococcota bacterium]
MLTTLTLALLALTAEPHAPTCGEVAAHQAALLSRNLAPLSRPTMTTELEAQCREEAFSVALRRCVVSARSFTAAQRCTAPTPEIVVDGSTPSLFFALPRPDRVIRIARATLPQPSAPETTRTVSAGAPRR